MMEGCCSRFTAAEGGARLAAAAATKNILAVEYASFIPVRLLYEKAYQIRGSRKEGKKRSIYITRASRVPVVAFELKILTDLGTVAARAYEDVDDWLAELESKEVVICTSSVLKKILEEELLKMCNINVLIVDSCHLIYRDEDLKYIMKSYKQCPREDQPIILALTYPLFTPNKKDTDVKDTPETKDDPAKKTETQDEDRQGKKETKDAQGLLRKKETEDETDEPSGALPRMTVTKYEEMGLYENVDDFDMYEKLEWKIEELEAELCCQMDLAEDIDGGKRISTSAKPRELIIEYSARPSDDELPPLYIELEKYMRDTVQDALNFIEDHRHDPTEIYGDEMYDEFMSIPHPTIDPKNIFKQFLYVLEQLGPFAADKAAISLLSKLEKLKIKIPYERHFILMCLCTTVFLKIRCYTELLFDKIEDEWLRIKTFSSPKVLRFAEILEKFKPPDIRNQTYRLQDSSSILTDTKDDETARGCDSISKESINKMLNDVEECDFKTLSNKIQDKVNTYESNLKDLDSPTDENSTSSNNPDSQTSETDIQNKSENSNDTPSTPSNTTVSEMETIAKAECSVTKTDTQPDTRVSGMDIRGNEIMVQQRGLLGFTRRSGYRLRGKTRILRNNAARALQIQQNPDALCGIVYMKEPLIAKVMFSVMVDMSRSNSSLNYISAQYCATETPADPGTEPRECQRQGKRQEDVLKKFRMHECNLLLTTSALEEGIDLPRCNLVLRWDIPASYRSYGLCRGRARATRSAAALLCSNNSDTTQMLLQNVATYRELDQIISRKCGCGIQDEPPQSEEDHADAFTNFVKPYSPSDNAINFYSTHTSQDGTKSKNGVATNVVKSGVVIDNVGNFTGKRKSKSKDDAKKNAKEIAKKECDKGKEIDRIENVSKENEKRSKNICLDKDSSKNDVCEGNNKDQVTDNSIESNNLEGVNNSEIINTKDNDNDTQLTDKKVNEAMEIVNDTITTVNEAINTVNEAIQTDGIDDLLNQMENLTVSGNVQTEDTQENSETEEIEVNTDEDESETEVIDVNDDQDEKETDFERERAEFVKKYNISGDLYEYLAPEAKAGTLKVIKPIISHDPKVKSGILVRIKDIEEPENLSTNDMPPPTNPSDISEQPPNTETENLDTQENFETEEIDVNDDQDEKETDFERERAEFVKKYNISGDLYEYLAPEAKAGTLKVIKPIISHDPKVTSGILVRIKDIEEPENLSTNDMPPPTNPSDISEQLLIAETENLDTHNLLSMNDVKNSTDPSNIPTELDGTENFSIKDNSTNISKEEAISEIEKVESQKVGSQKLESQNLESQKLETQNISNEDNQSPFNVSKQLTFSDTIELNTQNLNTLPNTCDILKQLITTDTEKTNTQNLNKNLNIPETSKTQIYKEQRQDNQDTKISKEDSQASVHCNKCFNVTLSGSCLCSNVNLYFQLIAKANVSRNEGRRNLGDCDNAASVDLSSAIALINRYCGKLPSDTFTRLAPQWWMEEVELPVAGSEETRTAYICTLRLPLNCPVKYNIVGHPMPTKVLARRMVALQACRILHKSGELDNQLMPIGKENFKAVELEAVNTMCTYMGGESDVHDSARPGSTKRRQYYYKRTAWAFTDCQPVIDTTDAEIYPGQDPETIDIESDIEAPGKEGVKKEKCKEGKLKEGTAKKRNMLYAIVSKLWCALPERYNTRGRRLHAPQLASQAIGILMSRHEPDNLQIPSFPVYTRSGEVRVSVEHVPDADVRMSPRRAKLVRRFMRFVFAEVLRVRRRGMKLQSEGSTHNNYYIVPTVKITQPDGTSKIDIDWSFLELIYQHTEEKKITDIEKPIIWQDTTDDDQKSEKEGSKRKKRKKMTNPLLKKGDVFVFDAEKYREAVVTPWYRNQDQPQFFLVAEICGNLTPDSSFPSACHQSFRDYYSTKYGVSLTQRDQPLLDVDHTSARLNLLTPRYVNRKGVALPVSSERTRRAKRDRLDQKQILIPELCRVHPFAAPLWFATVALPCVLYRINALLIADEIRRAVAIDVGLGIPKINDKFTPKFQWPPLDFGWSLAEVLSQDSEKHEKRKDEESKKELKDTESSEKVEKSEGEEDSTEEKSDEEVKEKTINEILQEKEEAAAEAAFEIGTWSNDMASSIPETSEYDDLREPLPPNLTFCTSASGGTNWCDPISRPKSQYNAGKNFSMADSDDSFMSSDLDSDDTDLDFDGSDEDADTSGFCSTKANTTMGVRIEYKTAHEAEAFDIERVKKVNPAPMPDELDDAQDREAHDELIRQGSAPQEYIDKFRASVSQHKHEILDKCHLITKDEDITEVLPETKETYHSTTICRKSDQEAINELFPFGTQELTVKNGQIDVESIEKNKRVLLAKIKKKLPDEEIKKMNCFSMKDINIDDKDYVNEKVVNVGFDTKDGYEKICKGDGEFEPYYADFSPLPSYLSGKEFDFDYQPTLEGHPGPSPSVILQALTMSNANDGINLERLETIGDSFLKFAITAYLYCAHPTVHEGKLSHMRSKQVSNLNLYRLGRNKRLGARMIASKFEPHDNWLPPCHKPPPTLHPRINGEGKDIMQHLETPLDSAGCFIPYNLITQHSIPDKSIADCVEALIGAYLLECGPRGALLFMSWLGIRVLPCHHVALDDDHPYVRRAEQHESSTSPGSPDHKRPPSSSSSCSDDEAPPQQEMFPDEDWSWQARAVGSLQPYKDSEGRWMQPVFGELKAPPSPLLRYINDPEGELNQMLSGYDALEETLQYRFKDRSLLLQALTHASHHSNRLTDCYQRLEFLGDAILDYLITRHLYEDPRRHSPGALTDLRSALVNNTIFATLAARHGFHKYFRHMSPGLNEVLTKYVKIQEENGHSISEEHYLIQEDEMEQAEDVEVPKALGDLFESVAGAIFLDSGMSLGAVWKSYVNLMGAELEAFSAAAPKSPVRELLEAEPDTAKFGKPERLADGRRVRVCVEVFGRGTFKGVGRNYRIAKGTAARCALRHLKGSARADN